MKGTVIISETLLEIVSVIISFIMVVLVVQLVFQSQTQTTYQSAFQSVARDISTAIDRAAASSGSLFIQQDLPKGLNVNVTIDYKTVLVGTNDNTIRKSFSALTNTPPSSYVNPSTLCIVKTQNDNKVVITSGTCKCNQNDNTCDAVCGALGVCDQACMNSTIGICNSYCTTKYPNTCDTNCYSNSSIGVCEVACISPNATTGVCSPDCNNVKKGVCSLDCYNQYSNGKTGNCDPDCPPKQDLIQIGNLTVKKADGNCYTGCINASASVISQTASNPSPIKMSCNATYSLQHNNSEYQCSDNDLWECGVDVLGCGGHGPSVRCSQPCVRFPGIAACCDFTDQINTPIFNGTDSVCCCQYNGGTCSIKSRGDCLQNVGYAFPSDSQYCQQSSTQNPVNQNNKINLVSDGVCDLDCNATANICDPDCPNSLPCQNTCMSEGQKANGFPCCSGLTKCPGTDVCSKTCCGNGICEGKDIWPPENKTLWETPYTCPKDCGNLTAPTCSPGGPFSQSVCYGDIANQNGNRIGDAPTWSGNAIQVCSQQSEQFLNRRDWDINQVLANVKALPPLGWAFDASRYVDACNRIQPADQTISANENYKSSSSTCCSLDGTGCPFPNAPFLGQQCAGVGYCADHAAAMLSILRTAGVPDYDVFMTFMIEGQNCGRHAFVVMKCDSSLPYRLFPSECQGHSGEWLRIDATQHFVSLLKDSPCVSMAIWWNDKGIYPLTYGALPDGPNNQKIGLVYPSDAQCNTAGEPTNDFCKANFNVEHHYDLLCKPFNVQCEVPG